MRQFSVKQLLLAVTCVCVGLALGEAHQRAYVGNPYGYAIAGSINRLVAAISIGAAVAVLAKRWWIAPVATVVVISAYTATCILFDL